MIIGVPKEIKNNENRVAITSAGVKAFVKAGHTYQAVADAFRMDYYPLEEALKEFNDR